jgi:hypothetical protein
MFCTLYIYAIDKSGLLKLLWKNKKEPNYTAMNCDKNFGILKINDYF